MNVYNVHMLMYTYGKRRNKTLSVESMESLEQLQMMIRPHTLFQWLPDNAPTHTCWSFRQTCTFYDTTQNNVATLLAYISLQSKGERTDSPVS